MFSQKVLAFAGAATCNVLYLATTIPYSLGRWPRFAIHVREYIDIGLIRGEVDNIYESKKIIIIKIKYYA